MKTKLLIILFLLLLVASLSSCNNKLNKYSKNYFAFGTEIDVTIYAKTSKEADSYFSETSKIIKEFNKLTDRYTDYENTSGIYYINHNAGSVIEINQSLFDLIKYSIEQESILLNDDKPYFTIGIGMISDIYHDLFNNHNGESFNLSDLNLEYDDNITTDTSLIVLDSINSTIMIPSNMSLDLGGIAKGYTVEILKDYYNKNNIKYVIDAGNSSISTNYGNPNRRNNEFRIGLRKPTIDNNTDVFGVLNLELNKSISTSAFYQKYIIVDNNIWPSIIDPYTYRPVETDILSISIITSNSALGDILSTTLYMAGYDKAVNFIESNSDIEGIIYKDDNTIFVSTGLTTLFEQK